MAGLVPLNTDVLVAVVNEFYTTTNETRRHEIDGILCRFKNDFECVQTVSACMHMISQPTSPPNVRYFGAISLYDVIRIRSAECIANETLQLSLKTFLIDSLTSGAYAKTTSLLNKLSATLAIFSLYCVPDLWQSPVEDLTQLLAGTPEVLLKVLSDMAAEFSHVSMPLQQRSRLKAELHKFSENIIRVLTVVLQPGGSDASTMTRQAAVECVEQWLRLPGMALDQWTNVLSDVLGAVVQDCTALASILDIIAENDEFHRHSTLIINICQYICMHVSTKIEEELREDATSEEIATLVASTCSVAEKSVATLVECATQAGDAELTVRMSQVMQVLANMPGQYPQDEIVSDLPACFFISLRTEIMQTLSSSNQKVDNQFVRQISQIYAALLDVAIVKMAFPRADTWHTWNLEDRDQFESYRKMRSETSYDSYQFSGQETLNFLNQKLEESLNSGDMNRSEACLYQWECVADYLVETDYSSILKCLEICASRLAAAPSTSYSSSPSSSSSLNPVFLDLDEDRRGATLMRLLYALSHLIQVHERAKELECALIPVILSYVRADVPSVRCAIDTLHKFVEDRTESLDIIGEQISSTCYAFFKSSESKDADRLVALKCIGYVLSRQKPSQTMKIIGEILNEQNINEPEIDAPTRHRRYAFQINTFSALFSSLTQKKEVGSESSETASNEEPTIVQLLREAIPVFETLCGENLSEGSGCLIQEVCKAVRSALNALPEQYLSTFFPFVVSLLNTALFVPESAAAACALAKSAVLQCGNLVGVEMANAIAHWLQIFEQSVSSVQIDEYLQFIYHVVRKNWKPIRKFSEPSLVALKSSINICTYIIINSVVPTEVRSASQVLAQLASYTTSNDDVAQKASLAEHGPTLIRAVFGRVQRELMRPTVEALAEVLFFYFREFTTETRNILNAEPYGCSALVAAMFREIGNLRTFKQMTIRFNNSAVRDPGSI
uniref:Xpo1 domain-containing protein n=1 Tax=Caenorhabditis japonica TaxID=281687 RepID=A0A8R1HRM9_CAEJA